MLVGRSASDSYSKYTEQRMTSPLPITVHEEGKKWPTIKGKLGGGKGRFASVEILKLRRYRGLQTGWGINWYVPKQGQKALVKELRSTGRPGGEEKKKRKGGETSDMGTTKTDRKCRRKKGTRLHPPVGCPEYR